MRFNVQFESWLSEFSLSQKSDKKLKREKQNQKNWWELTTFGNGHKKLSDQSEKVR